MKLVTCPPVAPPGSATEVADVLTTIAAADQQLALAMDAISVSSSPVSLSTVITLERLLFVLRPAADERLLLTQVDPAVLRAGLRLWAARDASAPTAAARPAQATS
jgi:hypothetical protein